MYEALDDFLRVPTWYTKHPNDEERFFRSLDKIVDDPGFHADAMGEHIDERLDLNKLPDDHEFQKARDHYVEAAWAVKRFLNATGR
jgi:hypothetical protein